MRPYISSYSGRVYTFMVETIVQQTDKNYDILILRNTETLTQSKLSSQVPISRDGTVEVGDIIIRQYNRSGVGVFGLPVNGYSSRGSTDYFNVTSMERWKREHPYDGMWKWIGIGVLLLVLALMMSGN